MKPITTQRKYEAIVNVSAPVSLEHVRAALQIHDLRKAVARVEFKEAA
jgi:protein gp37